MPLNVRRLRLAFVTAAVLLLAVIAGFYFYARMKVRTALRQIPQKLGVQVQQTAHGYHFARSEAGRTLFTIDASNTVQYKEGGHAELQDVTIIVYGRQGNRFDQIYSKSFEYDPQTKLVTARGEVHIDLQSNTQGAAQPDQAPPVELKNPIHVKTSGLVFDQKTGEAETHERVEFATPQASGSAVGARYDSHKSELTLESQLVAHVIQPHGLKDVAGSAGSATAADVEARHGVISKEPLLATLQDVRGRSGGDNFSTAMLRIYFRDDATVEKAIASGGVSGERMPQGDASPTGAHAAPILATPILATQRKATFRAQQVEAFVNPNNTLRNAVLSGNVVLDAAGPRAGAPGQPGAGASAWRTLHGQAERVLVEFGAKNAVQHVRGLQNVVLTQQESRVAAQAPRSTQSIRRQSAGVPATQAAGQAMTLTADSVDADVQNGRRLEHAWTTGAARIVILQTGSPGSAVASGRSGASQTVVTAGRFDASFDRSNHLQVLHGAPDAKIVSSSVSTNLSSNPGQPDRVTSSRELDVAFNPGGTGIASMQQRGDFQYKEGTRMATAAEARYNLSDETFALAGAASSPPRYSDGGLAITAERLRLNRRSGEVNAEGTVKTTYVDMKPQPGGAMLASGSPIHVTAQRMVTSTGRASGASSGPAVAVFSGGARLWQEANIVEAPTIQFDREARTMLASGAAAPAGAASPPGPQRVSTVFVQTDKSGKVTPVSVAANSLRYSDGERRAHFEGGVTVRSADATLSADSQDVFLQARSESATRAPGRAAIQNPQQAAPKSVQPSPGVPGSSALGSESPGTPSQLDRIVARGHIVIQQPNRRATGEQLVYTASDGKFVLTGSPGVPPSIFDAEHGTITGNSLTFFSRDDRVLVESGSSATVPQTRVSK